MKYFKHTNKEETHICQIIGHEHRQVQFKDLKISTQNLIKDMQIEQEKKTFIFKTVKKSPN
jgi:hypothetical protein